jgi:uncharacterized protein
MTGDLVLKIKVLPKSPKSEIVGTMEDGTLKVRIAAVAEKGKANAELIAFLSKHYGVPKQNIEIFSGQTSPLKQVRIRR